jgi:hypothetical protein
MNVFRLWVVMLVPPATLAAPQTLSSATTIATAVLDLDRERAEFVEYLVHHLRLRGENSRGEGGL